MGGNGLWWTVQPRPIISGLYIDWAKEIKVQYFRLRVPEEQLKYPEKLISRPKQLLSKGLLFVEKC